MALFDQQQQDEEQQNQIQPYGVCVGSRRVRTVQRVPYVPDMNIGRPLFRARQHHAYPVREQQHVMLQDRIDQDDQHNIRQDNIAYNRRLYNDPQRASEETESTQVGPEGLDSSTVGKISTVQLLVWPAQLLNCSTVAEFGSTVELFNC